MPDNATQTSPEVAWRVHPAAERLGVGVLVLGLVLVLSFLAGIWMEGPYWGAFAFVVLFLSLEAFFLPSRYALSPEGVEVAKPFSKAQRPWTHFRRVVFDAGGITLSPFARRSWLETYRALRLRYPGVTGTGPGPEEIRRYILEQVDAEKVTVVGPPDDAAGK